MFLYLTLSHIMFRPEISLCFAFQNIFPSFKSRRKLMGRLKATKDHVVTFMKNFLTIMN